MRLIRRAVFCGHNACGFDVAALFDVFAGLFIRNVGDFRDDTRAAVKQFFVHQTNIYHIVFISFADANHGAGGKHIENHFLSGARFHTGGAGQGFFSDDGVDKNVGKTLELCFRIGADADGFATGLPGLFENRQYVAGAAVGRNADDNVIGGRIKSFEVGQSEFCAVFRIFNGESQGIISSGYKSADHTVFDTEGRPAFRCVQYAQSAAGSGTKVSQPSPFEKSLGNEFNGPADLRQRFFNRKGNFFIFIVDGAGDLQRIHQINVDRIGITAFGKSDFSQLFFLLIAWLKGSVLQIN